MMDKNKVFGQISNSKDYLITNGQGDRGSILGRVIPKI